MISAQAAGNAFVLLLCAAVPLALMLHLFAPFTANLTSMQKRVKRAISGAGFTWPSMTDASETARSSDGTEQHLVFEFETAEGIEG